MLLHINSITLSEKVSKENLTVNFIQTPIFIFQIGFCIFNFFNFQTFVINFVLISILILSNFQQVIKCELQVIKKKTKKTNKR